MVRKFSDTKIQWGEGGSREDVIFRLGDTYLLCAEAYLGAGKQETGIGNASTVYVSVPLKMRPLMKQ